MRKMIIVGILLLVAGVSVGARPAPSPMRGIKKFKVYSSLTITPSNQQTSGAMATLVRDFIKKELGKMDVEVVASGPYADTSDDTAFLKVDLTATFPGSQKNCQCRINVIQQAKLPNGEPIIATIYTRFQEARANSAAEAKDIVDDNISKFLVDFSKQNQAQPTTAPDNQKSSGE